MSSNHDGQVAIRGYLLGALDEVRRDEFEQRFLTNDGVFEELLAGEDELIDQYVSGELNKQETEMFENNFLATSERQQKVRFAKALKKYAMRHASQSEDLLQDSQAATQSSSNTLTQGWQQFFFASPWRIAAFAALILVAAVGVWRVYFYQSDVDKGLIALNAAYRQQRPLEARITRLDYAPFVTTRGVESDRVDSRERDRSERYLLDAVRDHPGAASYHALGKFYLTKKDFDQAISQLEEALKSDSKSAQIYADLGAAYLEKGKLEIDRSRSDPTSSGGGKGLEDLGRSYENLHDALELNPNLLEALFNRALCEQSMTLYAKAEEDWRQYLQADSTSPWADEARQNLKALEERRARAAESEQHLAQQFLESFEVKNDDQAWIALSHSQRRTGNSIVEKVLDDFINLSVNGQTNDAQRMLQLLLFAGDVQTKNAGDHYTSDLIKVYSEGGRQRLQSLSAVRNQMKLASASFNKNELDDAIRLFTSVEESFRKLGDIPEALFARSWLGYSLLRIPKPEAGIQMFDGLSSEFEQREYTCLLAVALNALGDAYSSLNEFSKTLDFASRSLKISEQVQDSANAMRCLSQRVSMHLILSDESKSLDSFLKASELSNTIPPEPRLLWPLYYEAALDFHFLHLPNSALALAQESMQLAEVTNAPLLRSRSLERIGVLQSQHGNLVAALESGERALAEARKISSELSRKSVSAHAMLILAELYEAAGDSRKSIDNFDGSLSIFQELKSDVFAYRAHKGKLLAHLALHNDAAASAELDTVVQLFEDQRKKIIEESNRDKFFDNGQDTYDLAINFAYSRQEYERAFEYAEASRARSLFEMMNNRSVPVKGSEGAELNLKAETKPLRLSEIQKQMPDGTQLLEYAVLNDKVLMWVVTRSSLKGGQTLVTSSDLDRTVHRYLELLSQAIVAPHTLEEIHREGKRLHNMLIGPIEQSLNKNLVLGIVPDKGLNYLPFAALLSPSGTYLIENYQLEESPSATVFTRCSETALERNRSRSETILSVGNPQFDRSQFANLADLPEATREANEIASFYKPATVLTGAAASRERVVRAFATADVIHLATHALIDERSPLASKLVLASDTSEPHQSNETNGTVEAFDIYGLNLPRTRLIVLSACQTGIERAYKGEGAIGLARPFIVAGVPLVIATLWPVESNSTANLMINFHRYRKLNQLSTVSALRSAQLEMLHKQQPDGETSYGWAAFTVIGGQATF